VDFLCTAAEILPSDALLGLHEFLLHETDSLHRYSSTHARYADIREDGRVRW